MPYKNIEEHRKEISEKTIKWKKNNPEKAKKAKEKWNKDNPEKCREYRRDYYKKKFKEILEKQNLKREKVSQYIREYKLSKGCAICGYKECANSLGFHHKDEDKKFNISSAIYLGKTLDEIKEEIKKCVVICANCHGELHDENTA